MGDEKLIHLVRGYNAIYNTQCPEYREVTFRNAAWEEVALLYGKPVEECKDNWNRLRNCYNSALRRRQRKGGLADKIPPWRFEEQMSFLKPFMQALGRVPTEKNDITVSNEIFPPTSPEVFLHAESPTYPESIASLTSSPKAEKIKVSSCSDNDNYIDNMLEMMKSSHDSPNIQEIDDLDIFFLSMSKMVKKLPKVDQIHIKLDLHKAVSQAELRQLGLIIE